MYRKKRQNQIIDSTSPSLLNLDRLASQSVSRNQSIQARYNPPPQPPSRGRGENTTAEGGQYNPQSAPQSRARPQTQLGEKFNPPPDPPGEPLGERSTAHKHTKEGRLSEDRKQSISRSETNLQSRSAEPSRKATESRIEPSDYTVKELKDELEEVTDREELKETLGREEDDSNRRTAKEAIRRRIRALEENGE